jgi:hypothetical protein
MTLQLSPYEDPRVTQSVFEWVCKRGNVEMAIQLIQEGQMPYPLEEECNKRAYNRMRLSRMAQGGENIPTWEEVKKGKESSLKV